MWLWVCLVMARVVRVVEGARFALLVAVGTIHAGAAIAWHTEVGEFAATVRAVVAKTAWRSRCGELAERGFGNGWVRELAIAAGATDAVVAFGHCAIGRVRELAVVTRTLGTEVAVGCGSSCCRGRGSSGCGSSCCHDRRCIRSSRGCIRSSSRGLRGRRGLGLGLGIGLGLGRMSELAIGTVAVDAIAKGCSGSRGCGRVAVKEVLVLVVQCQGIHQVFKVFLDIGGLELQDPILGKIGNLAAHDNVLDGVIVVTHDGVQLVGLNKKCLKVGSCVGVDVGNPIGWNLVIVKQLSNLRVIEDAGQEPVLCGVNKEVLGNIEDLERSSSSHCERA